MNGPDATEAPAVPHTAVVEEDGVFYVYVHVSGETFERRAVRLGNRSLDFVAIEQGVHPGERVVSGGIRHLRFAAAPVADMGHGHAH